MKLQSIVMPLSEFDHAEKGDALYGEFHGQFDIKMLFLPIKWHLDVKLCNVVVHYDSWVKLCNAE